jgi:DNA replication and repair protein RecF
VAFFLLPLFMKLIRIQVNSFRNIASAVVLPNERFNIFVGNNGHGKTNLLEAIFLLGTLKSFRTPRNSDLIGYGLPFALIKGWGTRDGVIREISLAIQNSGKKAFIDQKPVTRPADFFGNLNSVVFSPEDITMVRGLPEGRRKFLDRAIFSGDTGYLAIHHEYGKILKNRNALLKRGEQRGLAIWTEQLAEAGARLMEYREAFVEDIGLLLKEYYCCIAGANEQAHIAYHTRLPIKDRTRASFRQHLLDALQISLADELRRGTTLNGPHRDDLNCTLNGKPLNHHGSQGEQRSFILALKMAEIEYLRKRWGNPPILLLDDMTSELDETRNNNLMDFLRDKDMQVFITTTSLEHLRLGGINSYSTFPVDNGKVCTEVTHG